MGTKIIDKTKKSINICRKFKYNSKMHSLIEILEIMLLKNISLHMMDFKFT